MKGRWPPGDSHRIEYIRIENIGIARISIELSEFQD